MPKSIFLIGYRASGKTSVGRSLAKELSLRFLDLDRELERRQGRTITELVAAQGWPHFRDLERELLAEVSGQPGLVVSTGGGAILHQELWPRIKAAALVIWLFADLDTVGARLGRGRNSKNPRPSLTGRDLVAEAAEVMAAREPLYRAGCHLAVDTSGRTVNQIVAQIAALAQELSGDSPALPST